MSLPPHAESIRAVPAKAAAETLSDGREPIRIRKYPNRRLYDTSRSRHLTHQGVIDLVAGGHAVEVTDSRSGADITNIVLLQILIERDPARLAAVPTTLLHRLMRAAPAEVHEACGRIARTLSADPTPAANPAANPASAASPAPPPPTLSHRPAPAQAPATATARPLARPVSPSAIGSNNHHAPIREG